MIHQKILLICFLSAVIAGCGSKGSEGESKETRSTDYKGGREFKLQPDSSMDMGTLKTLLDEAAIQEKQQLDSSSHQKGVVGTVLRFE